MNDSGGDRISRPRVLFTSAVFAFPANGGPTLRIENSVKALARSAEVHVVCRLAPRYLASEPVRSYYGGFCSSFYSILDGAVDSRSDFERRLLAVRRRLSAATTGRLAGILALDDDADHALRLVRFARRQRIPTIWFGYGNTSYGLIKEVRRRAPELLLVCDTDSVWSRFVLRELPFVADPERRKQVEAEGRQKEIEERDWVRICDVTTAVSETDAAYYRSLCDRADRIAVFGNAIDLAQYRDESPVPADFLGPSLLLAGTFWKGSPMEQAARWMVSEVLPRLPDEWRHCRLYIAGRGSLEVVGELCGPQVRVLGQVASMVPYLRHADVVVVPLMFESGTRFKILEAGASRKPVVSTTLGAEGLPVTDGGDILIADTPGDFAAAISEVLGNTRRAAALGRRLHDLVSAVGTLDALSRQAGAILDTLSRMQGTTRRGPVVQSG